MWKNEMWEKFKIWIKRRKGKVRKLKVRDEWSDQRM